MSWIDEARMRVAKRRATEEAAAEAKRVQEAKERAAFEATEKNKFTKRVIRRLPRGVELVSVFNRPPLLARVHVGNGVQFDLTFASLRTGGRDWEATYREGTEVQDVASGELLGLGFSVKDALQTAVGKYDKKRMTR